VGGRRLLVHHLPGWPATARSRRRRAGGGGRATGPAGAARCLYTRDVDPQLRNRAIQGVTSRLKYPQLLVVTAIVLLLDLVLPDLVPFADEILLALLTTLFALWREPVPPAVEKPPEKDVTPRGRLDS
jgi:hypothetical protein